MHTKAKRVVAAGISLLLIFLCTSCSFENKEVAMKLFKNRDTVSYSSKYYELKESGQNRPETWRQGMISGNGKTGFITSGSPYSDSMIFQNVRFVMPNGGDYGLVDVSSQLDDVKQAIVNGTVVNDGAGSQEAYAFHPGGALRMTFDKYKAKRYIRYTDYETGEVGLTYADELGTWERKSFTSFADDAVFTRIASLSGARTSMVLSFDDLSTFANFGAGNEVDAQVKTLVNENASYIAFLGHYPNYENSGLADGGWLTLTYVRPEGGSANRVYLERNKKAAQDVSDSVWGIQISNAYAVNLITVTKRIDDLCNYDDFAAAEEFKPVRDATREAEKLVEKYNLQGEFDYEQALRAHEDVYSAQFNAVTLTLEAAEGLNSNDSLIGAQKHRDSLNASYVLRAYYAGRYAMLCCGSAAGRSTGLWTGEFNPGWGGKYLADDFSLQTASMGKANITEAPVGYALSILRQAPDWENNAAATHGFENAIQAPAASDGDSGALIESSGETPYRYWNAGAAMMLRPLYEAVLAHGDLRVPLTDDVDLDALRSVLSVSDEELSNAVLRAMEKQGYLSLQSHILLPLLIKAANYWVQMADPAYYTDADGGVHYEADKASLGTGERYCLLPCYTPNGKPDNYDCALTANAAVDIAASRDTIAMLLDVIDLVRISNAGLDKDANETLVVDAAGIDTSEYASLLKKLPDYFFDEYGGVSPWATTAYYGSGTQRSFVHLSCAWPFSESKTDSELWEASGNSLHAEASEETNAGNLARRALVAASVRDRGAVTKSLLAADAGKTRYASFMTNELVNGKGAYNASYAIGFTAAINDCLLDSDPNRVVLLPCLPESGFDVGSVAGLRTRSNATITLMSWDLNSMTVIADVTADVDQTLTFTCPLSSQAATLNLKAGKTDTVMLDLDLAAGPLPPASESAAPAAGRDISAAVAAEKKALAEKEAEEAAAAEEEYDYDYDYDYDVDADENTAEDQEDGNGGFTDVDVAANGAAADDGD